MFRSDGVGYMRVGDDLNRNGNQFLSFDGGRTFLDSERVEATLDALGIDPDILESAMPPPPPAPRHLDHEPDVHRRAGEMDMDMGKKQEEGEEEEEEENEEWGARKEKEMDDKGATTLQESPRYKRFGEYLDHLKSAGIFDGHDRGSEEYNIRMHEIVESFENGMPVASVLERYNTHRAKDEVDHGTHPSRNSAARASDRGNNPKQSLGSFEEYLSAWRASGYFDGCDKGTTEYNFKIQNVARSYEQGHPPPSVRQSPPTFEDFVEHCTRQVSSEGAIRALLSTMLEWSASSKSTTHKAKRPAVNQPPRWPQRAQAPKFKRIQDHRRSAGSTFSRTQRPTALLMVSSGA